MHMYIHLQTVFMQGSTVESVGRGSSAGSFIIDKPERAPILLGSSLLQIHEQDKLYCCPTLR